MGGGSLILPRSMSTLKSEYLRDYGLSMQRDPPSMYSKNELLLECPIDRWGGGRSGTVPAVGDRPERFSLWRAIGEMRAVRASQVFRLREVISLTAPYDARRAVFCP